MDAIPGTDRYRPKLVWAAADAGQYDAPPPRLLTRAWRIKRWGALPEAGGLLDQPAGLMQRMAYLSDVYNAHRAWRRALESMDSEGLARWQEQNADVMNLMAQIREERRG